MATLVKQQPLNTSGRVLEAGAPVEDRLRAAIKYKNVRIREFFRDFDPLRKGSITISQFERCLTHYFNIVLTEHELAELVTKYGEQGNINYQLFCQAVDKSFDPDQLDGRPDQQVTTTPNTTAGLSLTNEELLVIEQVIQKCHSYYRYRGIVVKDCYADFDRHHVGLVTPSQFHRSFPGPPDISEHEVSLLAKRYLDKTGMCSYQSFHDDVCKLHHTNGDGVSTGAPLDIGSEVGQSPLQQVMMKISNAVYKNGVRTTEFFKDHDKLNSGIITENQFLCGLSLCCGQLAHLSRNDMQLVAQHYRTDDGRVNYRKFCDLMEHTYNVPQLEKRPTEMVQRPARGHLLQQVNALSSDQLEVELANVLQRLRGEVKRRQILVYPYFQDFDRSCGQTGGVTRSQFERIINFLSLPITVPEMELIAHKFSRPVGGDINYVAFAQAIDDQFTGHTLQTSHTTSDRRSVGTQPVTQTGGDVDMVLARIKEYVYVNRVRIGELFKDNDPLRSGMIAVTRFRQGLIMLPVKMSETEVTELCQRYGHPTMKDQVKWKMFVDDIDQVFTDPGLERAPTKKITSLTLLPREGATVWEQTASDDQQLTLQSAMDRLAAQLDQRRLLARPYFQDFDRHKHGYVTSTQFHQCLSQLGINLTNDEVQALIGRFSDKEGVNYLALLQCVQPSQPDQNKYQLRMTRLMQPAKVVTSVDLPSSDKVMVKIRIKVCRQPVRVVEFFKDYDKSKVGRVSVESFRRGLDLCNWRLSQDEMTALINRYQSVNNTIDYQLFADHIESVFTTQQLEKTPLQQVVQFVAPPDVDMKELSGEEEQILAGVLLRMADRVRERRVQLVPLFEDYDPVHSGCVSHSQFHRVLDELQLYSMLSSQEMDVLAKRFGVHKGGRHDLNYIHFCAHVNRIATSAHVQLISQ